MDDETLPSSPDPLALSNESLKPSPIKSTGPIITPRKPLASASGNARVQDFYISTPPSWRNHNSPLKSSNHDASTSPWRIRLTVQAEQVSNETSRSGPHDSPAKRHAERTTTVTIPLKGGDDTSPAGVKKGKGRPKKSLGNPSERAGTPKPKTNGRRKTKPETVQEKSDHGTSSSPKKTRGRPRKSIEPQSNDLRHKISHPSDHMPTLSNATSTTNVDKPTRTRSRARRKEITPKRIALNANIDDEPSSSEISGGVPTVSAETLDQQVESPSSERTSSDTPDEENNEQAPYDPTNEHQEYDTILESEGFSMVSVSSLASTTNHSNLSEPGCGLGDNWEYTPAVTTSPSAPPEMPIDALRASARQLNKPQDGTPKLARVVRAGIALQGVLSPRDSNQRPESPPQESRSCSKSLDDNEGAAGHDAPSLDASSKSPKERLDMLFGGFGAGTRRELRAGLRLGEELAKRQRQVSQAPSSGSRADGDVFGRVASPTYPQLSLSGAQSSYSLSVPKPKESSAKEVAYPGLPRNQLPTPDRSESEADEDRISCKGTTPVKSEHAGLPAGLDSSGARTDHEASGIDHSMMRLQAEWQREREAVSRQIEMANKSQVIVIDDDDDEYGEKQEDSRMENISQIELQDGVVDEETSDIWQAEAHSTNSLDDPGPEDLNALPQQDLIKPRRSKLPNSWRRNNQVIYSDEVESSEADLFWQPSHAQKRAKDAEQPKKRSSEILKRPDETRATLSKLQDDKSHMDNQQDDSTGALIAAQLSPSKTYVQEIPLVAARPDPQPGISVTESIANSSLQLEASSQQIATTTVLARPDRHEDNPSKPIEEDTTASSINSSSIQYSPQNSIDESFAPIDPLLLNLPKPTIPHTKPHQKPGPRPALTLPSESWLSYLTGPLTRLTHRLPPPATVADILLTSPYEPLCQLTPWEPCHTRALGPLYYSSLLYGSHIFAYNSSSPSARYLGLRAETDLGWSRDITKNDCAVAEAFMVLLDDRGFALGEQGQRWIDEGLVVRMCVELWMRMCLRGELDVQRGKGEVSGLRRGKDKMWVKERDVDWSMCQVEYFERKRREFDGLPSWKARGIRWPV